MSEFLEFQFANGSSVLLQAFPAVEPAPARPAPDEDDDELDLLPPGLAGGRPVSRGPGEQPGRVAKVTQDALRAALSPLVPLLQEVHDTVAQVPQPPHEVSVEFGVRFGADLKLGIVGGSGEASMKVSATWQLPQQSARTPDPAARQTD
ncbi:CU044_2847 family protein [Kitasatospora viridis]|uniref:CU044_2847 family protein n=1 Tax=Kitasatospora viridis TaxID=281105 RepID=UPI001FEAE75C|nr:CU044_2847 family protein [Kitasatospora viridis]